MCLQSKKKIALVIDEVDSASNNQVFLDFLSQLRAMYLERSSGNPAFHSVILVGVTEIKKHTWNITANFDIDMSVSETGIKGILDEYEADHRTGMNTTSIARKIRSDTNGYPFLVSQICECLDEEMVPDEYPSLPEAWTIDGVEMAIKPIVPEDNQLFGSLTGKLSDYPELYIALKKVLFQGGAMEYKSQFTKDGILNVPLIMEQFIRQDGRGGPLQWPKVHHRAEDMARGKVQRGRREADQPLP